MITIITRKRWRQMLEECQRMQNLINSHIASTNDLLLKLRRMEKTLNEALRENRALRAEIKKMKKDKIWLLNGK